MKEAIELLLELKKRGVRVSAKSDQLICEALPGILTAELKERLRLHKADLLRWLAEPPLDAVPVVRAGSTPQAPARGQLGIWLLEQLNPGTPIWNVPAAFRIEGPLDRARLQTSFQALLRRHDVLRSRFLDRGGEPVVECLPLGDWALRFADFRDRENPREAALALANAEALRPFDLATGPLCRGHLLRIDAELHLLVIVLHHIVADGWSLGIIARELGGLYGDENATLEAALPSLKFRYADFVATERAEHGRVASQVAWWAERLAGELPSVTLANDPSRPNDGSGQRRTIMLGSELTARIEALARAARATPFVVLMAAFKLLVHRYTGLDDILVGTPVSGRSKPEFVGLVGMFVNTLVLRTSLEGDPTFLALVERVRQTSLDAFAHADAPFDRVVEAVRPERRAGRNPLIQLSLAYQNMALPALRLDAARVTREPLERAGSRYELAIEVWPTGEGMACDFEYATGLFEEAAIERLMEHYRRVLAAVVTNPELRLSDVPFIDPGERRRLLHAGTGPSMVISPQRVHELFEIQAARTPGKIAIAHGDRSLDYAALDRRANRIAHRLRAMGVGPEILVGVCLGRTPDMVAVLLAIAKAGGAYLPLDPSYPPERLAFMLEDTAAPVLVTETVHRDLVPYRGRILDLDRDAAVIAEQPAAAPCPTGSAEDVAYVIYTSGSTGRPNGVAVTHGALSNVLGSMRDRPGLGAEDVVAAVTTISFDIAALELFLPLTCGARIELLSAETTADGARLARALAASGATVLQATPATWRLLIEAGWSGGAGLRAFCGGDALPRDLADKVLDRVGELWNLYGPTETTIWSTVERVRRDEDHITVGRPIANTRVYVLDATNQPQPIGVPGDVWIAGAGLARGYVGRPDLTAERFQPDPFGPPGSRMYRTGDIGRWTGDGRLVHLGRVDHQVKIRGFRIELVEIENVLSRCAGVRGAVVVKSGTDLAAARLVAYVEADPDTVRPDVLQREARRSLPKHMVPSSFVVMPRLPLTPTGKVDRKALPAPQFVSARRYVGPRTAAERAVSEVWGAVLGLSRVGADDNFFELGGNSLLLLRVADAIAARLQVPLRPIEILRFPTVSALAASIEGSPADGASLRRAHNRAAQRQAAGSPRVAARALI